MTDLDFFRSGGATDSVDERARRAVKVGRKLQPTLTAYARVLCKRKDITVELSTQSNAATNGKKILWRPPLELGDEAHHVRALCDKRDDAVQLLCPACGARERVLVKIYHEIGHNCFGTFTDVSDADKVHAINMAIAEVNNAYGKKVKDALDTQARFKRINYLELGSLVSPFLPILINALEDARVNSEMFKARKGTKIMFEAEVQKIFTEGVEQVDQTTGEIITVPWNEYPQNMQIMAGVLAVASGYTFTGWFIPPVEEALKDIELVSLIRRLDTVRSVSGVYGIAFPILARLRELGFCKSEIDPPEDEPEEEESEETGGDSEPETDDQEGDSRDESDPDEAGTDGDWSSDSERESSDSGSESGGDDDSESDGGDELEHPSGSSSSDDEEGARESGGEVDEGPRPEGQGDGEDSDGNESGIQNEDGSTGDDDGGAPGEPSSDEEHSDGGVGSSDGGEEEPDSDDAGEGSDSGGEDSQASSESSEPPEDGNGSGDDSTDEPDASGETGGSTGDQAADEDASWGDQQGSSSSFGEPVSPSDDSSGGTDSDEPQRTADSEQGSGDIEGSPLDGEQGAERQSDRESSGPGGMGRGDSDVHENPGEGSCDVPSDGEGTDPSLQRSGDEERAPRDDGAEDSGRDDERSSNDGETGSVDHGDDEQPVDSGADRGLGGTELVEDERFNDVPMGDENDADFGMKVLGSHDDPPDRMEENPSEEEAMERAIVQGVYFETPSRNVFGVREHKWDEPVMVKGTNMSRAWDGRRLSRHRQRAGIEGDFMPSESILGPALLRMRVAFTDNKRGHDRPHQRSGKVNPRVLGRRAWQDDDRLFRTRTLPGKKSYFVCIGVDCSGSTIGLNLSLEKRAVMAQAELLSRMGIDFAIYAHTGDYHDPEYGRTSVDVDIYLIKEPNEPWNKHTQQRLEELGPAACNLDGHTLEYYRKILDRRPETNKIIMYYTDGKMPAENHDEELEILQREIKLCARKNYLLLGVGIRTDSPIRHGLDTVQVDDDEDLPKVVKHLEKRLAVHTQ